MIVAENHIKIGIHHTNINEFKNYIIVTFFRNLFTVTYVHNGPDRLFASLD